LIHALQAEARIEGHCSLTALQSRCTNEETKGRFPRAGAKNGAYLKSVYVNRHDCKEEVVRGGRERFATSDGR